jgi:hypothetical protein
MKKVGLIIGGILVALLLLLLLVPVFFKDAIFEKVDQQLAKTVNADVHYDSDNVSLSLFRNFPNVTASLEDFSVVNRAPFAGDTLVAADRFSIVLNLGSVIFGDKMEINAIELDNPLVQILVNEEGLTNYDIAIADETLPTEESDTTAAEFNLGIKRWQVQNGRIVYEDLTIPIRIEAEEVTHGGSGDFTQDIFDLRTTTEAQRASLVFDGIEYVSDKHLEGDVTLEMNLPEARYTFKDNLIELNNFAMKVDGDIIMPGEPISFNLRFSTPENTFKSLLSLVPGVYNEHFEELEARGEVGFEGYLRGAYSAADSTLPGYRVALSVKDGYFKYPDLPQAVENVNVNMVVEDPTGDMQDLLVNIKDFSLNMGQNPAKGSVELRGLHPMQVNADVDAKLNLAELDQILKLDTIAMRGVFSLNLKAKGVYDTLKNRFPEMNAQMQLADGYIKTATYPVPIQNFNFNGSVVNTTGKLENTVVNVPSFGMLIDQDKVTGRLRLEDMNDYRWDVALQGAIDFTTIQKIVEFEDMELAGRIIADIQTKGRMSAVENEQYDQLPTSGTMAMENFSYSSVDLPFDFLMSSARMQFNPQSMQLQEMNGKIGDTDMSLTGTITNYIGYALKDDQTLRGNLKMVSQRINVNQWMSEDGETAPADTAGGAMTVVEIPQNLDLTFAATAGEVIYDNLTLENMVGTITAQNGVLRMENLTFNTLGGGFGLSGTYDPRNTEKPAFDFNLKISDLSISNAYANFNTIKALAPIAQKMDGTFSTDFKLSGLLGQDMMPQLNSLTGSGLVEVLQATLENSKILQKVALTTKLTDNLGSDMLKLKDLLMKVKVADGFVNTEPFDFNIGNVPVTIGGRQGLNGALDYTMNLDVPAGAAGQALNSLLSKVGAGSGANVETIKLNLGVGGTYNDPSIKILGGGTTAGEGGVATSVADAAKDAVKQQVENQLDDAKAKLEAERQQAEARAKEELEKQRAEAEARAQAELEKRRKAAEDSLKKKATKGIRDILGGGGR